MTTGNPVWIRWIVSGTAMATALFAFAGCPEPTGTVYWDDDDVADDDDDDTAEACPADVEEALADLEGWTERVSCGRIEFGTAPDDDQLIAITVGLDLWDTELTEGATITRTLDGDPDDAHLETGENLLHYDCNDALWLEEIVHREWVSVAGTATVHVVEVDDEYDMHVDLTFEGVVVEDRDEPGATCTIPDITWEDLYVGWLPG